MRLFISTLQAVQPEACLLFEMHFQHGQTFISARSNSDMAAHLQVMVSVITMVTT